MQNFSTNLARLALALLMITSVAVPSGPVGTAAAAEKGDCSDLDDFVMFLTLGAVNAEDCSRQAYREAAIEEMKESDQNQTRVDLYSHAAGLKSGTETWQAPFDNYVNDTESVAWMKAQVAIAEAYQNNSTEIQAQEAAREAIRDYYAVKQINLIEQWNNTQKQFLELEERAAMEGISESFIGATYDATGDGQGWTYNEDVRPNGGNYDLTLVNGSTRDHFALIIKGTKGEYFLNGSSAGKGITSANLYVQKPNSEYDDLTVVNLTDFSEAWIDIEQKTNALEDEADNYVTATYDDFESGKINASDVISSHTAMFEYGIRSANESEGLYRSTAALSMMGFDTPNMSSSGLMNVTYQGTTYQGLVLAESAPGGAWQANTTYDTANISGPVFMATQSGQKVDFAEGTTFTINSMTARDGTTIQTQDTTEYVYKTANTTELLALQNELTGLRQEIEDREPTGGGGGGCTSLCFGGLSGSSSGIALVAVAVVLLYLRSDS